MSQPATFRIKWLKPKLEAAPKAEQKPEPAQPPQASYGPPLWKELHEQALSGSLPNEWLAAFEARLPCGVCRQHWREMLADLPPQPDFFAWSVAIHNGVNRKLGKPELTLTQAAAIWKK
jgi:hypothetical protein